jgi:hypothetical protein
VKVGGVLVGYALEERVDGNRLRRHASELSAGGVARFREAAGNHSVEGEAPSRRRRSSPTRERINARKESGFTLTELLGVLIHRRRPARDLQQYAAGPPEVPAVSSSRRRAPTSAPPALLPNLRAAARPRVRETAPSPFAPLTFFSGVSPVSGRPPSSCLPIGTP